MDTDLQNETRQQFENEPGCVQNDGPYDYVIHGYNVPAWYCLLEFLLKVLICGFFMTKFNGEV